MRAMDYSRCARAFKAFGDINRLYILQILQGGEQTGSTLLQELPIGQPTLSHHMKQLCDANLVTARKEGKWTVYSLNILGINEVLGVLSALSNEEEMTFNPNPQPSDNESDFY